MSPLNPMRSSVELLDAGRDEDFKVATDSEAAPEDGLRLAALHRLTAASTVERGHTIPFLFLKED